MKNLFGTDGIRGRIGTYPLTLEGLSKLGILFGSWAFHNSKLKIIIATDTRSSAFLCKHSLISGLLHSSLEIYDAGILPTPVLHYIVQKYDYDYGIAITASHNDAEYNGIKILSKQGKLTRKEQASLENHSTDPFTCNYTALGKVHLVPDAFDMYAQDIYKYFESNFLQGTTVVLDCAHGAWSYHAETLFKHFGAHVISIASSGINNHINEKCGSLHPTHLQKAVLENNATIGFAFDGDGDRVIAVTHKGHVKNGDDIISILMDHPLYASMSTIVGTIMTNQGLAEYALSHNKYLVRTSVGDCHILNELQKNNQLLGGEPSGHIILRDFSETSDGLFAALRCIETLLLTNNLDGNTFYKYPQEIRNIPVASKKDIETNEFKELIESQSTLLEKSRIMVRYSGTEPVVRILVEYNKEEDKEVVLTHILPVLTHYFV